MTSTCRPTRLTAQVMLFLTALLFVTGCQQSKSLSGFMDEGSESGTEILAAGISGKPVEAVINPVNGHYYALFINKKENRILYEDAQARARKAGGYLATITDAQEQAFIQDTFVTPDNIFTFLGARQLSGSQEPEGGWAWDVTNEPWSFTNWYWGEPNNSNPLGDENIVQIYLFEGEKGGLWNDNVSTLEDLGGICNAYLVEWDSAPKGLK